MTIGPDADDEDRLDVVAAGHQATAFVPLLGREVVHQLGEAVEQVAAVVGTGPGLGVVLDPERRHLGAAEPLERAVVEVHVGDLDAGHAVESTQ